MPLPGQLPLTDIVSAFHLMVSGEKVSKSTGNFYSGDQLLGVGLRLRQAGRAEPLPGRSAQRRLRTPDLGGALEVRRARPRRRAGRRRTQRHRADGPALREVDGPRRLPEHALEVENYARIINRLFAQYKPHDDRHPEEARRNALFSAFSMC
jgi:methionyl-tRNA synthetase